MATYYGIEPTQKLAEFSALGTAFRRGNWDGTHVQPDWLISKKGTFDITEWATEKNGVQILAYEKDEPKETWTGKIGISLDGVHYVRTVSFVANSETVLENNIADPKKVTIAELKAIFEDAFNDEGSIIECEVVENQLNIKASNSAIKYVEIFGYLAGAFGFGGGEAFTSLGSFFRNYITDDDTITCQRTEQRTDNTNIDQLGGGKNTLTRITIAGGRTGAQYTINLKPRDKILKQIFEGGKLYLPKKTKNLPAVYEIPEKQIDGMIEMYRLAPLYQANMESKEGQELGVVIEHVFAGMPTILDGETGAMTLSSFNYQLDCGAYIDKNKNIIQQPVELEYSKSLWLQEKLIPTISNEWTLEELEG